MIHSAFKISSSYIMFHSKVIKIENILEKNMYPVLAIDNQINNFMKFNTLP